ncbi:MAG: hypothetical protein HRT71_09130 [Flavobacteriales bacterium]|nr:hypothetical protein [Flavobacteriales bacterium]
MKKFILLIILFFSFLFALPIGMGFLADGYTDPYYLKFTTPKQQSLILGNSRAAHGLQPGIFQNILNKALYNYAFTEAHSPFGSVYFESIKRKLSNEPNGIFIVTVDPWSICSRCKNPNDSTSFRENDLCVSNTNIVDMMPNFEYLFKNLKGKYENIIAPPNKLFLQGDGWLEGKDIPLDSFPNTKRIDRKVEIYKEEILPKTQFSTTRLNYLLTTIKYLSKYGKVYLVRLPIDEKFMQLEDDLMPNFNQVIHDAIEESEGYLDLTPQNNKFNYTDGSHLYKTSGKEVSAIISNWIKEQ